MNLLLDTHVLLWWLGDDARLGGEVRELIARAPLAFVSAASALEAAIKARLGKLRIPAPLGQAVAEGGFSELPVRIEHAEAAAGLPDHHADPFDRMLVAQARIEGLTLVTHDRSFADYDVAVVWV